MKDKILILGASGFIGGYLVEEALSRELEVYAGIRKTSNTAYLTQDNITLVYPPINNKTALKAFLSKHKFDYIIHNIGLTKARTQEAYDQVNVKLVEHVAEALSENDYLKKLVFISSLAAYGPADYTQEGIVTEASVPHPVTYYGKSKLKAEQALQKYAQKLPLNIVRPTAVYGPREKDFLTLYKTIKSGLSITIGKQTQQLSFIYVTDLTRAILDICLKANRNNNYFVSHPVYYSGKQLNDIVKNTLSKSTLSLNISPSLLRIIGRISEIFSTFAGNYPAMNKQKVNELACISWVCDIETLRRDTGFEASVSLEEGMKTTIQWNLDKSYL